MRYLAAGVALGLAGSLHCAAMCGPLTWLAGRGRAAAVYHAARLGMYVLLGGAAALAGGAVAGERWSRLLAIAAGAILLAQSLGLPRALARLASRLGQRIAAISVSLGRRLPEAPLARAAVLGAANSLLPCGLLYGALVAAAGFGEAAQGALFALGFGAGSLPAFAGLGLLAAALRRRAPRLARALVPVALAVAGLLMLARALPEHTTHDASAHTAATHVAQ